MKEEIEVVTYQGQLSSKQRRRVEALKAARQVLRSGGSVFGGSSVPTDAPSHELIQVAAYILTGDSES